MTHHRIPSVFSDGFLDVDAFDHLSHTLALAKMHHLPQMQLMFPPLADGVATPLARPISSASGIGTCCVGAITTSVAFIS